MARLYNLARMTTSTTGTGTLTLGSAATGFLSFSGAGISDGETVTYAIEDGVNSEIGRGVYTASGTTLTRNVLKSTNSNSAINLSGSAQVFITVSAEDVCFPPPLNTLISIAASVSGNALTIALKNSAGSDASAASPIDIAFKSTTETTSTPVLGQVTGALSLVVSSGSTLGTSSSVPFRLWVVLFNDAGTLRLGVINCVTGGSSPTAIYALNEGVLTSSTAEGGAGAADSAATMYTGSAVTTKAYRILGSMEWSSGLGTAGTWSSGPSIIQLYGPGSAKAGDVVQTQFTSTGSLVTGTTAIPLDDTIPQNTEGTQLYTLAITPIHASNVLRVQSLTAAFVDSGQVPTVALFRDSTANALAATQAYGGGTGNTDARLAMEVLVQAASTSSTTFKVRGGPHSSGNFNMAGRIGSRIYGGVNLSSLHIQEIMS